MTRRTAETFFGFDQPAVVVTLTDDDGTEHEHGGELRAWAVDDQTGDWWGMAQYRVGLEQFLAWLPAHQLRRDNDHTDNDGLVEPVAGNVASFPQRDT